MVKLSTIDGGELPNRVVGNHFLTILRQHWIFALLLLTLVPFMLIDLSTVPLPWFDEGLNLAAARTLAETNRYALPSADGLRFSDPAIQTGPIIIMSLALLYRLGGPNLGIARLFFAVAGMALIVSLYVLSVRLYGRLAAFLGIIILVIIPSSQLIMNFVMMCRQVLGEIPAALLICLGLHYLLKARQGLTNYLIIGILWGIAVTIKAQVLLVLTLTVGIFGIHSLLTHHHWRTWFTVLIGMMAVYALDFAWRSSFTDPVSSATNLATLIQGTRIHILPFNVLNNISTKDAILRLILSVAGVGGVLAWRSGALSTREFDHDRRRVEDFLVVFTSVWMVWYIVFSIGWARYAFVGQIFLAILLGALAARLLERYRPLGRHSNYINVIAFVAAVLVLGAFHTAESAASKQSSEDFYSVIRYLETDVPGDATILTWEWLATYFTDHHFVLPPTSVTNAITAHYFLSQPYDPTLYDPRKTCPDFLLYGSFEVDRDVMGALLGSDAPEPVFSQGIYQLYKVPADALPNRSSCLRKN